MSAGLSAKHTARALEAGRAKLRAQTEDNRRGEFLRAIDCGQTNVTEFELNFIESFLGDRATKDAALDFQWFTPRRREVVDSMIQRYGMRTLSPVAVRQDIPQAEAGCCGYLVTRDGRRNQLCGAVAVTKLLNGLELCAPHKQEREENLARLQQLKTRRLRS